MSTDIIYLNRILDELMNEGEEGRSKEKPIIISQFSRSLNQFQCMSVEKLIN